MLDRISAIIEAHAFPIALVGAALVKVALSETLGWRSALVTFFVSIFCAWVMTDPAMELFGIGETYRVVLGATIALLSQGVVKTIIMLSSDKDLLRDIIVNRFGGKPK